MAGAGYKLFNTGDVLTAAQVNTYLMEQTVMVFANAAARTTALSGVVSEGMISYLKDTNAVEVYDGSNWVSSDDPNAIQNSIINAKGDLIVGSANDTPSILSVSSDGSTLVADSSATTGLRYNPLSTTNFCINGGFDFWQRGTSSSTNAVYLADRWYQVSSGTTTHSQQTDVPTGIGVQYSVRWLTGAATSYGQWFQALESALVKTLRSQVVTVSAYFKTAGSYSGTLAFRSRYSNSTDTLTSVATDITNGSVSFNGSDVTSWTRKSYTFTVPSDAVGLTIELVPSAAQASGVSVFMTGVQMELGSTATAFKRAGGTLAGELAACQRYYFRTGDGSAYRRYATGQAYSATQVLGFIPFPVVMRTAPTALEQSGTASHYGLLTTTGNVSACTSVPAFDTASVNGGNVIFVSTGLGSTAGYASQLFANNTSSAYLAWSAEL